jgi:hypothetical protein
VPRGIYAHLYALQQGGQSASALVGGAA